MVRSVGVDLHKYKFTACFLEGEEAVYREYSLNDISKFKQELRSTDMLAVEATTNSEFFLREVEWLVGEVKLINTFKFRVISESHKKTDKNDAYMIALFLSKDLLPEARRRTPEQKRALSLAQGKSKLVKARTSFINQTHSLFSGEGITIKKGSLKSNKNLKEILKIEIDESLKELVETWVGVIERLNESIKKIEKTLGKNGQNLEGYENLNSIKGIGEPSATILAAIIGDINDFENEKRLASYLGMVPFTKNSADKERSGGITKRGNSLARTTLVQCAWVAIRYSPYLREFYDRKKKEKCTGKAIIATARRLLTIIYHTLKNNRIYTDFPKNEYIVKEATSAK